MHPPKRFLSKLRASRSSWGIRNSMRYGAASTIKRVLQPLIQPLEHPRLAELFDRAHCLTTDPIQLLRDCGVQESALSDLLNEYAALEVELNHRKSHLKLAYPATHSIGNPSSILIYSLVRHLKPNLVVETGVADGQSTFLILSALRDNGKGELVSFDISRDVGALSRHVNDPAWQFKLLPFKGRMDAFRQALDDMELIDIYLHDSDHRYRWMAYELKAALERMSKPGLMVCDDADANYSFLEMCEQSDVSPMFLLEERKVLGILRPGGTPLHPG